MAMASTPRIVCTIDSTELRDVDEVSATRQRRERASVKRPPAPPPPTPPPPSTAPPLPPPPLQVDKKQFTMYSLVFQAPKSSGSSWDVWTIQRRYSQFYALRAVLAPRYARVKAQPFPPKVPPLLELVS